MKTIFFGGVVALAMIAAAPSQAEPLLLATGNDYKPFSDESLPQGGFMTEVVTAALDVAGMAYEIEWLPWKRGYALTVEAEYDATFPYFDTADRRAEMLFSAPMYRQEARIYTRAGEFEPQLISALDGKTVCNPLGYALPPSLGDMLADDAIKIAQPDSMQTCLKQLAAGRIDAVASGVIQARDTIEVMGLDMADFAESPFPTTVNQLHFLVSRSRADAEALIAQFNEGLATIRENGTFAEIERRHMSKYLRPSS